MIKRAVEEKKKAPEREESILKKEEGGEVKDNVLAFKRMYLKGRRTDKVIPSLESDWTIGRFDFEDHLERLDGLEQKEIDEFQKANPKFKKINEVCTHWLDGRCMYADYECTRLHIYDAELFPICRFFIRDNSCTNPDCIFRHPGRDEQVICIEYARGFCKNGSSCDNTHLRYDENERESIRYHVDEAMQSHRDAKRRAQSRLIENKTKSSEESARERKRKY